MTLFCYGDSNTWGYDPRSYLGERYPQAQRWTGRLQAATGWQVENCGLNGREIPRGARQWELAGRLLDSMERYAAPLAFWVMLGSNDLLSHAAFTAEDVGARMEAFLRALLSRPLAASGQVSLRLLAPPSMGPGTWVTEAWLIPESRRLGEVYGALAGRLGIAFTDCSRWELPLCFDGVHLSAEGHRIFAEKLLAAL